MPFELIEQQESDEFLAAGDSLLRQKGGNRFLQEEVKSMTHKKHLKRHIHHISECYFIYHQIKQLNKLFPFIHKSEW